MAGNQNRNRVPGAGAADGARGGADAARHAARAISLAGLMRALPFHASAQRLYLPQDLLAREGVDPEDIFARRSSPGLCAIVRRIGEIAGKHLQQSRALRSHVPRDALPVFFPMVIAHKILHRLHKGGFDPFHPGMILHHPGRLIIPFNAFYGRY